MKKAFLLFYPALFLLTLLPVSCQKDDPNPYEPLSLKQKTADFGGTVLHEWFALAHELVNENQLYGPHAARAYAYMGLTAWESVYPGIPGAQSLAGQINDYPAAAPYELSKEYNWELVLCSAMRRVMPDVIDQTTSAQRSQIDLLADQQAALVASRGIDDRVRANSEDLGLRISLKILDRVRRDNRDVIRNIVPILPERDSTHNWYWDRTTFNQSPVEPLWSTVSTFVITSPQSCEPESPLAYSELPSSPFYFQARELSLVEKSSDNKALAYHFEDGQGSGCTPACHWMLVIRQLLMANDNNLAECSKIYCLTGLALADGISNSWYAKYKYNLMRPATYIRQFIDPTWTPLVNTAASPDYSSSEATIGGAVPQVLKSVLPDAPFVDQTHLGRAIYTPDGGPFILPERSFESLTQFGEQQAMSGVVAGVHFRRSCEEGLKSGRCVGATIASRLKFGF
jgi:hypothetical protein